MSCREIQAWLDRWLDAMNGREPSPEEPDALTGHLSRCVACREQHAAVQRLAAGLRLLPRPLADAGLGERIVARAIADRNERRRRFQSRLNFTIGLAASILLMVIAGYIWLPGPRKGAGSLTGHVARMDLPPAEAPPKLARTMDAAKDHVASLTERFSEETLGRARHLLAAAPTLDLGAVGLAAGDRLAPAAPLRQAGEDIKEGLEPVSRSAGRAVRLFFRELSTLDVREAN